MRLYQRITKGIRTDELSVATREHVHTEWRKRVGSSRVFLYILAERSNRKMLVLQGNLRDQLFIAEVEPNLESLIEIHIHPGMGRPTEIDSSGMTYDMEIEIMDMLWEILLQEA